MKNGRVGINEKRLRYCTTFFISSEQNSSSRECNSRSFFVSNHRRMLYEQTHPGKLPHHFHDILRSPTMLHQQAFHHRLKVRHYLPV